MFTLLALMCLPVQSEEAFEKTTITLELPTTTIRACDPLLLRLRIDNGSNGTLIVDGCFPDEFKGNLHLEIRKKNEPQFRRIVLNDIVALRIGGKPMEIKAGQAIVAYEVIHRTGSMYYQTVNNFMIPSEGDYEFRVRWFRGEKSLTSPTVLLKVKPISATQMKLVETSAVGTLANPARWGVMYYTRYIPRIEDAIKTEQALTDCYAKTTLRWGLAIIQIQSAKTPDDRKQAEAHWQALRPTLDPVTGEAADLMYALVLVHLRDYRKGQDVLDKIKNRSRAKENIQMWLDSRVSPEIPLPPPKEGIVPGSRRNPPRKDNG